MGAFSLFSGKGEWGGGEFGLSVCVFPFWSLYFLFWGKLLCHCCYKYNLYFSMAHRGYGAPPAGLTLVSWNVRGLGNSVKCAKVFSHLKSLSSDIAFLQETHIRPAECDRLRSSWADQIFQSTFSSKARGVTIVVKKGTPFKHISTVRDPGGLDLSL